MKKVKNEYSKKSLLSLNSLLLLAYLFFGVFNQGVVLASTLNPAPPANPVRLVFVHHSVGEYWLNDTWATHGGALGTALRDNSYFVSDTNYGWGPDSIGDRTDIGHWWDWFRGTNSSTILSELYNLSAQNSTYERLTTAPAGENEIVMFKSCFYNSALRGNPNDPIPLISSNPLRSQDYSSEYNTVANAKGIYIDILEYFRTRQDKLFIVVTAPPQYDPTYAANTRAFNEWLTNDWLKNYPYNNVAVFDFYNVLTTNSGNANTNDLNADSGNHHRWRNGVIQHKVDGDDDADSNVLEYPSDDDHPTQAGNQKATGEFVPLLNTYYNCWKNLGGCPGAVLYSKKADFNGDGKSDVLWQNTSTGQVIIWLMNGTTVASGGSPATVADQLWQIKATGDFNGDGKSDILWQNTSTGQLYIWLMNGTAVASAGSPATVADQLWQIKATGDFNGDGNSDIMWYNVSTGQVVIWLMNGTTVASGGSPATVADFNWQIKAVGDFDGDGKVDVLWQSAATGQLVLWLMNAAAIKNASSIATVPSDWQIKGVGDHDGNGKIDILWQNTTTGSVAIWFMNGASVASTGAVAVITDPWLFKDAGDYNGDGKDDLLWQNTSTGQMVILLMNGSTITSSGTPAYTTSPWLLK
ncbi:MAG: VCBS repeat-containing protein [Nitrospirae bacterium]|nr:VCBS repeat-containing protein [Nitrospirota bacterium]